MGRNTAHQHALPTRFRRRARITATLYFLGLAIFSIAVLWFLLQRMERSITEHHRSGKQSELIEFTTQIEDHLESVETIINTLAHPSIALPALHDATARDNYTSFVQAIGLTKRDFTDIRLVDRHGQEHLHMTFTDDGAARASTFDNLHNLRNAPHLQEAYKQQYNDLYVSRLTLSHGHDRDAPPVSSIHFIKKVRHNNDLAGFVVMHVRMDHILAALTQRTRNAELQLVDSEGWYLVHPDPELRWGFLKSGRKDARVQHTHPDLWQALHTQGLDHFRSSQGDYSFLEIHPAPHSHPVPPGKGTFYHHSKDEKELCKHSWHLIQRSPLTVLEQQLEPVRHRFLAVLLLLLPLCWWISSRLAHGDAERRWYLHRLHQAAHYDELTSLMNRRAFSEEFERFFKLSERTASDLTLAYIDVNNLKVTNDTLGHEAGDTLIAGMARAIHDTVRSTDITARIGGDEFVILFPDCSELHANQVMERIASHYAAVGDSQGAQWSFSWGCAQRTPEDTQHTLMTRADERMYQHKMDSKQARS